MEHAKWNLDLFGVQSIRIAQISFISDQSQTSSQEKNLEEENRKRLLVLSHQICYFGTPSFYFEELPEYTVCFPDSKEKSVVMVYDYFSNFDDFKLPLWIERSDFIIDLATQNLHKDFLDHLQLSLVLYYYYFYRNQNPLYFTSFLLFPYTDNFSDPFLFRPIPVLRHNRIHVRNITSEFSSAIIDPPFPLSIHSYIFIEPYSHPFFVDKIEEQSSDFEDDEYSDNDNDQNFLFFDDKEPPIDHHNTSNNPEENPTDGNLEEPKKNSYYATLVNIDQTTITRKIDKDLHYILLTQPHLYLAKLQREPEEKKDDSTTERDKLDFYKKSQLSSNFGSGNNPTNQQSEKEMNFPMSHAPLQMQEIQLSQKMAPNSSFFNFESTEFYTFDDQSYRNFFKEKFQKTDEEDKGSDFKENEYDDQLKADDQNFRNIFFDSKVDYFEYPECTFLSIISESVSDKEARKYLMKTFSRIQDFPNKETNLILPETSFISFFQFEIPLCKSEPLKYTRNFTKFADIEISHLSYPTVRVNANGNAKDVNPKTIFEDWKNCHYLPISGKKMANFVVFIVDYNEKNRVIDFFDSLQAAFSLLELGVLKPCHKKEEDAFIETTSSDFFRITNQFFETNNQTNKFQTVSEFQQYPIISFVVSPIYFNQTLKSHSICSYLSIDQIKKMKQAEIDNIAFTVYSRIRIFHPYPFGMIDIAPQVPASLFYGYRYQHPYLLSRSPSSPGLTLHIAWDPISKIASWVDDIGTACHNFRNQTIPTLCRLILEITQFLKEISVDITFSILSELPPDELINQTVSLFGCYIQSFSIFSIIPTPQVQIVVNNKIEDDIIIFEDFELTAPLTYVTAVPKCSCYVSSPNYPTYRISHYFNSKSIDAKKCLHDFAKNMSHLSWLSSDPQTNQRLFSFPPHVASLMRKVRVKTKIVTGFEFLS